MVNDSNEVKQKLSGYEFYRRVLGSPRYVVAPMVDQSELAWRMLCRRYGAELCYSPMFHANLFANDLKYRKDALQTCPEDRPLIIQFCGNDPQQILEAALAAQDYCDAVDINLGCPQAIAKRGHYGSFLQDEWELLTEIVRTLHENLTVPVTCKIRSGKQWQTIHQMVNDSNEVKQKLSGYEFYRRVLGSPRYVVAPMVDQSELAWRMLCRRYGAELCYSPMFHANLFANDLKYRKDALQTCPEDRPLIIQFCGNDPQQILEAALAAQDYCDAVDINLGCPQAIAKRGHYGSFLQDEWELLTEIVRTLHENLTVPVTCKIRRFEDREKTIKYAKMLEAAGCQLLTVHGRTREQKGPLTGIADWSYIKDVREHIKIPMFANGNILGLDDVHRCLDDTGVDGVMTAEGNLHNPALFKGMAPPVWQMAKEYLEFVNLYPCPTSYIRGHLFKLFHHIMNIKLNSELREQLATANQLPQFQAVVDKVQAKYEPYYEGKATYEQEEMEINFNAEASEEFPMLQPWLCQPYIRASPESHRQKIAEKEREAIDPNRAKRQYFDNAGNEISRKRMKKLRRRQRRPNKTDAQIQLRHERHLEYCTQCANPLGSKCEFRLCRICCRDKCYADDCDCPGHGILIKSRRAKAKQFEEHSRQSVEETTPAVDNDVTLAEIVS